MVLGHVRSDPTLIPYNLVRSNVLNADTPGMVDSADNFTQNRIRLLRRVSYALNTNAIMNHVVTPEGPFDAALANGLAVIAAHHTSGSEYRNTASGRVHAPAYLLSVIDDHQTGVVDTERLREGIGITQRYRHGRADDESERLTHRHIDALAALDRHDSLQVLDHLEGLNFDRAVEALWANECQPNLVSPKEKSMMPPIAGCDSCGRSTMLAEGLDDWGCGPGAGLCLACGYRRTEDDVIGDATQRVVRSHP